MSPRSPLRLLGLLSLILWNIPATHACSLCGIPSTDHSAGTADSSTDPGSPMATAPFLSSRPGAAYTLYLNFDGFNYTGQWGNTGTTPGNVPAYTGSQAQIQDVWARTAEKYSAFNVNVTTVDPSGFQSTNYSARQTYFDSTPRVMQTVIGGNNAWYAAGTGGVSYVGVIPNTYSGGYKTNWVFPENFSSTKSIAEATAHENGHAFGLSHQGDDFANNEYSTNNGASGNNSYAPIMGVAYNSQKGTWSTGTQGSGSTVQNDVNTLLANPGMSLIDSGIGHTFATATTLPLTGSIVDSALAKGVITPLAGASANPIGIDNYTKDVFKFTMGAGGNVSLTASNSGSWLTPGVLTPGGTLRSKLNVFKASDLASAFGVGLETANTSATTFSGFLDAGDYYAQITSFGGYTSAFDNNKRYFDMGSYGLSGSGILPVVVVVPESGTMALVVVGLIGLVARRRKS